MNNKTYLGDSVYAEFDGDAVVLTTENGIFEGASNIIVLDHETFESLVRYWNSAMDGDNRIGDR